MNKRILIFGREGTLVETRRQVLASNGISSETATDRACVKWFLATTPTELLVICSSVDVEEQEIVTQFAHQEASGAKCLLLVHSLAQMPQSFKLREDDSVIEALSGPEAFVREVVRLTA